MPRHIEFGREGEELAARWLAQQGFSILQRNWRHGRFEVDIIAGRQGILHFIEVKARHPSAFGYPEQSVNRKKIENVMQGSAGWLLHHRTYNRVLYDVLSITISKNAPPECILFEDVYG